MPTRRQVTQSLVVAGLAGVVGAPRAGEAELGAFKSMLDQASLDVGAIEQARVDREGLRELYRVQAVRGRTPRIKPSTLVISDQAVRLIVFFEVTDEPTYKARLTRPVWPGGDSGITIGIGYDLGYAKASWFKEDWGSYLSVQDLETLATVCEVKGNAAKERLAEVQGVVVPWGKGPPTVPETWVGTCCSRDFACTSRGGEVTA